ncbi:MAG: hypothetical protein GX660_05025 [Clostridiaceae bacterium]|nr:hypothetical protein [Clostridiaceae bacterium]
MKVLIAYASRHGSTKEVAGKIAHEMRGKGRISVIPVQEVYDISLYDTVLLGSAIRMGKLLPEAKRFLQKFHKELASKSFYMFVVCMTMSSDTKEKRSEALSFIKSGLNLYNLTSKDIGLFGGVFDVTKLPFPIGIIARLAKVKTEDVRDWNKIEKWARRICRQLS